MSVVGFDSFDREIETAFFLGDRRLLRRRRACLKRNDQGTMRRFVNCFTKLGRRTRQSADRF
jgi:hypothetical protein